MTENDLMVRLCSKISLDEVGLCAISDYAMRIESGRQASIMRLKMAMPIAALACRYLSWGQAQKLTEPAGAKAYGIDQYTC
jgi:hypothetical protein